MSFCCCKSFHLLTPTFPDVACFALHIPGFSRQVDGFLSFLCNGGPLNFGFMIFDLRFQIDNRKSAIENEISPLEADLFTGRTIAAFKNTHD